MVFKTQRQAGEEYMRTRQDIPEVKRQALRGL